MHSTGQRLNRDISVPNPDGAAPDSALRPSVHDRWMRIIGLLLLGFVIPRFALLFDKLGLGEAEIVVGVVAGDAAGGQRLQLGVGRAGLDHQRRVELLQDVAVLSE